MTITPSDSGYQHKTLIIKDPTLRKGFTTIPNAVMFAKGLSMSAKYLYGLLLLFAWQEGECFPGQAKLSEAANCTDRTIRKYLDELKKYGLISWVQRGLNQTNVYYINDLAKVNWAEPLGHKDRKERSGPDRKGFSGQERKERSGQDRKGFSDKEDSVEKDSVNNSCITFTGNTTEQSSVEAGRNQLPSAKDLITELTGEYRSTGAVPRNGDFAFIGSLYNRHGYEKVLEGIHELSMAMAAEEISKPLLYLKNKQYFAESRVIMLYATGNRFGS